MLLFITGLTLTIAGLLLNATGDLFKERKLSHESPAWPQISGEILESHVVSSGRLRTGTWYAPIVKYRYAVDGISFESYRVSFRAAYVGSEAQEAVLRYPIGSAVPVWYRPNDPGTAVLEPNSWGSDLILVFVISCDFVAVLVGLFFAAILFRASVPKR
jgi:hypothetical protein